MAQETRKEMIDRLIREQNVNVNRLETKRYDEPVTDHETLRQMVTHKPRNRRSPVKRASSNARAMGAKYREKLRLALEQEKRDGKT